MIKIEMPLDYTKTKTEMSSRWARVFYKKGPEMAIKLSSSRINLYFAGLKSFGKLTADEKLASFTEAFYMASKGTDMLAICDTTSSLLYAMVSGAKTEADLKAAEDFCTNILRHGTVETFISVFRIARELEIRNANKKGYEVIKKAREKIKMEGSDLEPLMAELMERTEEIHEKKHRKLNFEPLLAFITFAMLLGMLIAKMAKM